MNDNNGILVGVFSDRCTTGPVPPKMQGKKIWYSPRIQEFWITDDDRHFINKFYAAKFKQFVDMEAIVFTSDSVRNEMIDEANRVLASQGQLPVPGASQPMLPSHPQQQPQYQGVQPPMNGYVQPTPGYGQPLPQQGGYAGGFPINSVPSSMPGGGYGYLPPQQQGYAPYGEANAGYDPMYGAAYDAVAQPQSDSISEDKKAQLGHEKKMKDPSRHLFGYFLTLFILTAVAMIVIVFGNDIASGVATLLQ